MSDLNRLLRSIKEVIDREVEYPYRAHGTLQVEFSYSRDGKGQYRPHVRIRNEGGWVTVEGSPAGKTLRVWRSADVRVEEV